MAERTQAVKWLNQELKPGLHDSKAIALSTTYVRVEEWPPPTVSSRMLSLPLQRTEET